MSQQQQQQPQQMTAAQQMQAYEYATNFRINALFALLQDQFAGIKNVQLSGEISFIKYTPDQFLQKLQFLQSMYQEQFDQGKIKVVK